MTIINLCSPGFDPANSYGRIGCELAYRLTRAGHHVNAYSPGDVLYPMQSAALREILQRPLKATTGGILLGYPTNFHIFGALPNMGARVAVTMFESTQLPEGWAEVLNQMRAVIVPAHWCARVFRDSGVTAPIYVVPLGVSETYRLVQRPVGRKPFTFLALTDTLRRKGWDVAALAFVRAFGDDPDYRLILKARADSFPIDVRHPNITTIRADYHEAQMLDLFAQTDALVAPTRGEGFYLFPLEYMATGAPAIVTDFSGPTEYRGLYYPIRYTMTPAWDSHEKLRGCGEWAEPDVDHLAQQMRYVASGNPAIRYMAEQHAVRIRRRYTWQRFAEQVADIWQRVNTEAVTDSRRRRRANVAKVRAV